MNGDYVVWWDFHMKSGELEERIIRDAVALKASDIHIEPRGTSWEIRLRIQGLLTHHLRLLSEEGNALVQRLKVKGRMNISDRRLPQDGSYRYEVDGNSYDLRLSTLPTVEGEKMTVRILYREPKFSRLDQLGLTQKELDEVMEWLADPMGLILIAGPTGSGKTTTLYTILQTLNTGRYNICTIEDPIEFQIEGINQVEVNEEGGLTFALGLRSLLRQDPDIIIIGEIRDRQTADMAIRASLTGHLVLATIHTRDAATAITRLMEMGIEPYLVSSALKGVISQKMRGVQCLHCSGNGCQICNGRGFVQRSPVFEVLTISEDLSPYILKKSPAREIRNAMKHFINHPSREKLEGIGNH